MNKQQFGNFIAENRKAAGLTQKELAARVHVTDKAVSKWERALSYPDVTLLEPLAEALSLGVEELMACRRIEQKKEDGPVRNLLELSRESLKSEKRKNAWKMALALLLMLAATLGMIWWYCSTYVREQREDTIVLKETEGGENYLYVKEQGHLLRLKCGEGVDFDAIVLNHERGNEIVYRLDCRWNRKTCQGTVHACEATSLMILGGIEGEIGSAIGLDEPLFGWRNASCETVYCCQDRYSREVIYTYAFWGGSEEKWNEERLLEVEDCITYAQADWDHDGEGELLIRTRWPEKPYTVYDMVDGTIEAVWVNSLTPELAKELMTPGERQEQLERELRSSF